MFLSQLRKHLADEIRNLPAKPSAATQSYALTTAVLARKMLDYLNAEDLTLPNGFRLEAEEEKDRPPAFYKLREVLDCIIHFRMLDQDDQFSPYRPTFDLITLYSDDHMHFGEHLYIRLTDYRHELKRLATDDLLVARYLLPCAVTRLNKVVEDDKPSARERREKKWAKIWAKINDEIKDKPPQERKKKVDKKKKDMEEEWARMEDSQRSISRLVANTWDILLALSHAGKVEIPLSPIDCYEKLDAGGWKKYSRFPTCREFFDGYSKSWQWARHNFIKAQIEGYGTNYILVDEIKPKENSTLHTLAIPLDTLIRLFIAVRKQIS